MDRITQTTETRLPPRQREGMGKSHIGSLPPRQPMLNKVRSRPTAPGQEYLEVYIKSMEMERLSKLGRVFGRLLNETTERWEKANRRMQEIQEKLRAMRQRNRQSHKGAIPW